VLNEEETIARAIESALAAATPYGGEVIVADSGSMDRSVEIAMRYPTLVVQLENLEERCCGVGAQLGYQHSSGRYVYILDGDMELDARFLRKAIEFLEDHPSIAAVGGLVREMRVKNIEFESRARHFLDRQVEDGSEVECLVGGGLYRRAAIEEVHYLTDRNLHGFEEYDIGARLRSKGWRLVRLNGHAVDHFSYRLGSYRLLWHRLCAGRLLSLGEILRAGISGKYLKDAVVGLRPIRFALGTVLFWAFASLVASTVSSAEFLIAFFALSATLPVAVMTARSGSLAAGVYSVVVWQLTGIALLLGLARARKPPTAAIRCRILHAADTATAITPASEPNPKPETARQLSSEAGIGAASSQPASLDAGGCCRSAQ
jgi:glycosyltransferase involved in cell wall biosynthesis